VGFFLYYPDLVRVTGSVNDAVALSLAMHWLYPKENGKTRHKGTSRLMSRQKWVEDTGLPYSSVRRSLPRLVESGLIKLDGERVTLDVPRVIAMMETHGAALKRSVRMLFGLVELSGGVAESLLYSHIEYAERWAGQQSYLQLQQATGLSRRQVRDGLANLRAKGLVSSTLKKTCRGGHWRNTLTLGVDNERLAQLVTGTCQTGPASCQTGPSSLPNRTSTLAKPDRRLLEDTSERILQEDCTSCTASAGATTAEKDQKIQQPVERKEKKIEEKITTHKKVEKKHADFAVSKEAA
jgi:hypothetical protein